MIPEIEFFCTNTIAWNTIHVRGGEWKTSYSVTYIFRRNRLILISLDLTRRGLQPKGAVRVTWFGIFIASRTPRVTRGVRACLEIPQWKVRDITRDLNKSVSHASRYLYRPSPRRDYSPIRFWNFCSGSGRALPRSEPDCRTSRCTLNTAVQSDLPRLRRRWLIATLFIENSRNL